MDQRALVERDENLACVKHRREELKTAWRQNIRYTGDRPMPREVS